MVFDRYESVQSRREARGMKTQVLVEQLPKLQPNFLMFECIYGPHNAELLHRGTAYCRACYNDKNIHGKLIDQ